jgi:hypothetical protein
VCQGAHLNLVIHENDEVPTARAEPAKFVAQNFKMGPNLVKNLNY